MDQELRPFGLTAPQYAVLTAVQLDPGISNASLAEAAFVTPQTMHGILGNLERDGLLRRAPDPQNARILRSNLTSKGLRILTEAHALVDRVESIMIASIGAAEAARLTSALARCAECFQDTR